MDEKNTKRDYLAQERTNLANERTLLAYWRTALAFLVLGAFIIKFALSAYTMILASVSILFGIALFVYGTVKYLEYKENINKG